jgi:hypothetical protein
MGCFTHDDVHGLVASLLDLSGDKVCIGKSAASILPALAMTSLSPNASFP